MDVIRSMSFMIIIPSVMSVAAIAWIVKLLNWVWFRPKRVEKFLRGQGLNGNPYRILVGDLKELISVYKEDQETVIQLSDDLLPHVFSYHHQIRAKYGENSFVWAGPKPRLVIGDAQLIKEIMAKNDVFHKPHPDPIGESMVGGLAYLEDEKWAKHRKIVNSAFHLDKLKNMVPTMQMCCSKMMEKWESMLVCRGDDKYVGEFDVWPYLKDLSGDFISRTAFGSSHERGRRIFELQNEQMELILQLLKFTFIPGWRYFPIKSNKRLKAISKEMETLLMDMINQRTKAMEKEETTSNDLLGMLLESNLKEIKEHDNKDMGMSVEEVIEECKLFYFAGSETTSNLLAWTMVLLSTHQEWQARAREEVLQVLGENEPITYASLNRLKIVTMILQEVLRLYPPAPYVVRSPKKTVKLGNLTMPKDIDLLLLLGQLHYDPKIWGDDAKEFKPDRFSKGATHATNSQSAFVPFGLGPRICVGQNFAMIEAKLALAKILQKFSFELSPSYLHSPFAIVTLQPQHGLPIILHKL